MVSLLMSMKEKKEETKILSYLKSIFAMLSDEDIQFIHYDPKKNIKEIMNESDTVQAAIVDVTSKFGLELAAEIRELYPDVEIMIIADMTISPIKYLNPSIKASALLLKPFEKDLAYDTLKSFIKQFYVNQTSQDEESNFFLKKKGEDIAIPYDSILYLEARNKKVFVICDAKEYGLYDSLETVKDIFPDYFVRCHRSFYVNRKRIANVKYAEGCIYLDNDEIIPVSRSYKSLLKGVLVGERD